MDPTFEMIIRFGRLRVTQIAVSQRPCLGCLPALASLGRVAWGEGTWEASQEPLGTRPLEYPHLRCLHESWAVSCVAL